MPEDRDPNNNNTNKNPNNNPNMPQNSDWDSETNPFVAFRRFADEQVSSVLQSITGLPSSISPPQSDNWTIFTDDKGYKSMAYRHRNSANTVDRDSTQNPGGNTPGEGGDNSSSNNNDNNNNNQNPPAGSQNPSHSENTQQNPQPPSLNRRHHEHQNRPSDFFGLESFFDHFEDHFFPFASSFLHPTHNFFSADMFNDSNSPTWPLTYVMLSPYSPLHLERQSHYRMHREQGVFSSIMSSLQFDLNSNSEPARDPSEPQWREAFEDLLRLENGKPMLERDSRALTKSRPENGIEWLHGLVKRGSLGDQWKYVSGTDRHPWTGITFTGYNESQGHDESEPDVKLLEKQSYEHDEAEAETELELYERFLQDIEAREREFSQEISNSPLLRALLEEQQRRRNVFEKYERGWPSDYEQGNDDTESWLDLVSGGHRKSVPESMDAASSVPAASTKDQTVGAENSTARVVSTMINTERTRLPDGSVQTKKVTTKRYEDGREETESLVETTHPRNEDGQSNDQNSGPKNGWFWKD